MQRPRLSRSPAPSSCTPTWTCRSSERRSKLRSGVALAAAGERELALERLTGSHRLARRLGARPLAAEAAREVSLLGESVSRRLGVRAAADAEGAGLSRRELEVVRLLAV